MHMMTGKVKARAVGAHQHADGVLNAMIVSDAVDFALSQQSGKPECQLSSVGLECQKTSINRLTNVLS